MSHPEWNQENSLTAPEDRDLVNRWKPEQSTPALSEQDVELAMESLNNCDFTNKFPQVDRVYADPPPPLQNVGLISFVPAKGAKPNENGVYGFAKLRGNFPNQEEANARAEFLIRNVDSYHQIYHTYVGRPFPMTLSSKFSAETDEIDIRKQTTESVTANIKKVKDDDQQEMKEIKERQDALIADTEKEHEDPYDQYITLKVKKAQLTWTYLQHIDKLKEVKGIIKKTRTQLDELDSEYPDFNETYYDKYMAARRDVGFKDTAEEAKKNFLQFLVEDCELPGIDSDFTLLANDVVQDILQAESTDEVKLPEEEMERVD